MSRVPLNLSGEGGWEPDQSSLNSTCAEKAKQWWNHWTVKSVILLFLVAIPLYFVVQFTRRSTSSPSLSPSPSPTPRVAPNCLPYLSAKDFSSQNNSLPVNLTHALNEVSALLEKTINNVSIPGFSAGISYRGNMIWYKGGGTTKLVNDSSSNTLSSRLTPPTENTIFRIGSISKVYPVLTLFHLVETGVIRSLDDEIHDYCPLFTVRNRFVNTNKRAPTWRQLASQLSGLPREAPCDIYSCNFTNEEMFSRISEMYLISPPYTRGSYSNLAFSILGRAQEYVVNETYEAYCTREMKTLGMSSTGFDCESVAAEMATGYNKDGSLASLVDIGWSAPAGQMYSSVKDLLTLSRLLLGGDTAYLSYSYLSELLSPLTINADGSTLFGTPWEQIFQQGYLVNRKGGNIDGFSTLMALVPQLEISVIVLWNGGVNQFAVSDDLFDILLPAFVEILTPLNKPVLPSDPFPYLGKYNYLTALSTEVIVDADGSMMIQSFSPGLINLTLSYVQPGLMVIVGPPNNCLFKALFALDGEYVHFKSGPEGSPYTSFEIPGLIGGGVIFNRAT